MLAPLNTDVGIAHGCLKLIVAVCSKPGTLNPVSILLTQNSGIAEELMQSLVERLETDEPENAGKVQDVVRSEDHLWSVKLYFLLFV